MSYPSNHETITWEEASIKLSQLKEYANNPRKITKEMLKTKSKWSPFEGVTFPGRVVKTIVKGKVYGNK